MANKNKKKQQNKKRVEKPKEEVAKTTESSIFNNTTTIQQEPKVEWYRLEDLNEDEIDDPFGDMIIEQRLLLNNKAALERIHEEFRLKDMPWSETLAVTSNEPLKVADVFDDLLREEAFYNQALEAAKMGRELAKEEGIPFLRPENFIATMLKDDKQMDAVRKRLLEEAKDGDEDALRRLQIFNKEQKKIKTNEREKLLKRKKKDGAEVTLDDEFNLDLDEAERIAAATVTGKKKDGDRPTKNYTRESKDAKYSLGKRKHQGDGKANPAKKGMSLNKTSSKRPGKAKRQKMLSGRH